MKPSELFRKSVLHLMEASNTKQSVIADALGFTRPNFNAYVKGDRGFSEEKRETIAAFFGKTYVQMLILGQFLVDGKKQPGFPEGPSPLVIQTNSVEEKDLLNQKASDYRGVPLMESGKLAAWSNGSSFDEYESPSSEVIVYLPELGHRGKHNLVAARVGGDSMDPVIPENSIIIIDKDDREFVDDKIFAVAIEDAGVQNLAVKYVRKFEVAKGFSLWSENRQYQPRLVTESDWLRLCVGRVIWMWRSFNG